MKYTKQNIRRVGAAGLYEGRASPVAKFIQLTHKWEFLNLCSLAICLNNWL